MLVFVCKYTDFPNVKKICDDASSQIFSTIGKSVYLQTKSTVFFSDQNVFSDQSEKRFGREKDRPVRPKSLSIWTCDEPGASSAASDNDKSASEIPA